MNKKAIKKSRRFLKKKGWGVSKKDNGILFRSFSKESIMESAFFLMKRGWAMYSVGDLKELEEARDRYYAKCPAIF